MNTNEPRIAYHKIAPEGLKHLLALETYLRQCGLEITSGAELVNLTLAITAINSWNRISIGFRTVPGTYQPRKTSAEKAQAYNKSPA